MTHNRIERLERDLVGSGRRPDRRGVVTARPGITTECSSQAFKADDGGAINLLCDRPTRGRSAAASQVNAFEAVEAVDIGAVVDVDARPSIDDPTTAGRVDPTTYRTTAEPTAGGADSEPTVAGAAVDPTFAGGTTYPPTDIASMGDPTIQLPSPNPVEPSTASPPPGATTAPGDLGGWRVTSGASEQESAFAQDIAAILAHASDDDTVHPQAPAPVASAQPQAPTPVPAAPQMGVGATSSHDVFDRMAATNRYDQGPITLSVDFTAMDRAIDRNQTTAPVPPPAAPADAAAPPTPEPARGATVPPPASGQATAPISTPPPTADVADVAAIDAITAANGPFRVTTDVPLVAQVPGLSCHAAVCASIVAWRDDVKPVPAEVAAATGYWEHYAEGRTAVYPDVLDAFGLTHSVVGPAPSATALKNLIERAGPLWMAASPPGERAVAISGVTGDGTSSGTMVDVVDPWARGMTTFGSPNPGSIYHQNLAELLVGIAGGAGNPVVIAQLKEARSR